MGVMYSLTNDNVDKSQTSILNSTIVLGLFYIFFPFSITCNTTPTLL